MKSFTFETTTNLPELPDYEPDGHFGPRVATGAICPLGIKSYASWFTLIVEVGKSRGWGDEKGLLDWKARQWATIPGVRFVLCIAVTESLTVVEYKLHRVERVPTTNRARSLPNLDPVPVVGPHTMVSFDSRELLLGQEYLQSKVSSSRIGPLTLTFMRLLKACVGKLYVRLQLSTAWNTDKCLQERNSMIQKMKANHTYCNSH